VEQDSFASPSASLEQRADQIKRAASKLGWIVNDIGPGQASGRLNLKNSEVIVAINYTTSSYSIQFDPETTKYDGDNVRKKYNVYVKRLEKAIYSGSF
jgi:hypothetical protein